MNKYPLLEIDRDVIRRNAGILLDECRKRGVEPFAVLKGFNALPGIIDTIVKAGYRTLASSRLPHLAAVKEAGLPVDTLGLRIPMLSEVCEVVRVCDISLNSEPETLRALDAAASGAGAIHKVILMRDLGDLREGIFESERFVKTACYVERELKNLCLYGVGANLTCYGSVIPTAENLSELAANAADIERLIGRKLAVNRNALFSDAVGVHSAALIPWHTGVAYYMGLAAAVYPLYHFTIGDLYYNFMGIICVVSIYVLTFTGWDRFIPLFGLPEEPVVRLKKVEERAYRVEEEMLSSPN